MDLICDNCHKKIEVNQTRICNKCGKVICQNCSETSLDTCHCNGEYKYLN